MHVAPPTSPDRSLGSVPEPLQRRPLLALVLLCLLLWLPGFFTLPATDRDEARFAQASRQMVDSGDYVRIRFGQEERNKKPAGIHWLQSAAVHAVEATGLGDRTDICHAQEGIGGRLQPDQSCGGCQSFRNELGIRRVGKCKVQLEAPQYLIK